MTKIEYGVEHISDGEWMLCQTFRGHLAEHRSRNNLAWRRKTWPEGKYRRVRLSIVTTVKRTVLK